jgi:hypothetical protein
VRPAGGIEIEKHRSPARFNRLTTGSGGVMAEAAPTGLPYGIIDPDYARVFTKARCVAWAYGYALAMHGSFTRDLDLIAVPWTERACDAEHLVRVIETKADLRITVEAEAGKKPQGRMTWTLMFKTFGDPRFIDLSVMPLTDAITAQSNVTER